MENTDTLQAMVDKAEQNALKWANTLQATGGALELPKCLDHVMYWKFSIQGAVANTQSSSHRHHPNIGIVPSTPQDFCWSVQRAQRIAEDVVPPTQEKSDMITAFL